MARLPEPYQCDVAPCTTVKGNLNHWFMLHIGGGEFSLVRWDAEHADAALHICSEQCAQKALAKWMAHSSTHVALREITNK